MGAPRKAERRATKDWRLSGEVILQAARSLPESIGRKVEETSVAFQDKTLTCRDCGQEFVWTAGEQEFFASRGLQNAPSRCPADRAARRSQQGGGGGGGYGGGPREMFTATCSNCGREARVPFQPRGDKPVYCSECFETMRPQRNRY